MKQIDTQARRRLLQFLLASPVLASAGFTREVLAQNMDQLIANPDQALNVFDFENVARQKLPPAHWGYLATGVDDEATLAANRSAFSKYSLRVRRMVDVTAIDMGVSIFGVKYASPIGLSPVSSQQAFHPEGEVGAAKAARAKNHLQILSTLTSLSVEEVNAAHGGGLWYQLYATDQWDVTIALMKRANAAGCPVLVVTVDLNGGSNRETFYKSRRADTRDCSVCHKADPMSNGRLQYKAMFKGIDTSHVTSVVPQNITWDSIKRLRETWPGKLVIKGLVTREDAELAVRHGVDGILVSNHGGRAEESGRATIDSLIEVIDGSKRKIPILVDGGFRRGTDIFKALALGATAVCVGRPYIWGLASFGESGVAAVLNILRRELATVMRQAGTTNLAAITSASVVVPRS